MSTLQPFLFPAFAFCWIAGLLWLFSYTRQLKKRYPHIHAGIYRDSFQKKFRNDMRLFMFLVTAKYSGVVAQNFKKQSDLLRLHLLATFLLLFSVALTIIVA